MERVFAHLHTRISEWVMALVIGLWGLPLLLDEDLFKSSFTFSGFEQTLSQTTWGMLAVLISMLRITFLIINGAWRKSAHLRAAGSILSVMFWLGVYYAYAYADFTLPVLGLVLGAIIFDFHSIWVTAGEAKKSDVQSWSNDTANNKTA
jgi:hypothetical protein